MEPLVLQRTLEVAFLLKKRVPQKQMVLGRTLSLKEEPFWNPYFDITLTKRDSLFTHRILYPDYLSTIPYSICLVPHKTSGALVLYMVQTTDCTRPISNRLALSGVLSPHGMGWNRVPCAWLRRSQQTRSSHGPREVLPLRTTSCEDSMGPSGSVSRPAAFEATVSYSACFLTTSGLHHFYNMFLFYYILENITSVVLLDSVHIVHLGT